MDLLKIYYQNARGIKTKLKNFYNNSHTNDYNILCITETWLNDKIDDSKILNNNYSIFRNDRNLDITDKEEGGGVFVAIQKNMIFHRCLKWESELKNLNIELVWLEINLAKETIYLCNIYIPSYTKVNDYSAILEHFESKIIGMPNKNFII